jgi:hypothetical protein
MESIKMQSEKTNDVTGGKMRKERKAGKKERKRNMKGRMEEE